MTRYTEKDAAKDTASTAKEVAEAHHTARDDSGAREDGARSYFDSKPESPVGEKTPSGISYTPEEKPSDSEGKSKG